MYLCCCSAAYWMNKSWTYNIHVKILSWLFYAELVKARLFAAITLPFQHPGPDLTGTSSWSCNNSEESSTTSPRAPKKCARTTAETISTSWVIFDFVTLVPKFLCSYSESRLMLSPVNIISRLMWSQFNVPFAFDYFVKNVSYYYHSVHVITFGLLQSDHIKRLQLYY